MSFFVRPSKWKQWWPTSKGKTWFLWFLFLLLVSTCIMFAAASQSLRKPKKQKIPTTVNSSMAELSLSAEVVAIDPAARTITVDWHPMTSAARLNCTELLQNPTVREVYIHNYILDHTSPTWRQEPPYPPVFVFNSSEVCPFSLWPPYTSFRTVTKLFSGTSLRKVNEAFLKSSRMAYPADSYSAPFEFYVVDPRSQKMSAPTVFNVTEIMLGYELSPTSVRLAPGPAPGDTRLSFVLDISRSRAVKLFVYSTVVTSWLVTISFLAMLAGAAVYNEHRIYAEMFVVPIGALFAFTSIRANLPGAPVGFGTVLDTFSIVPVLIIMSLSSFLLLMAVFYKRVRQIEEKDTTVTVGAAGH
ncbi:hypothetical protein FA15DRAFT_669584 [Coprinopsis marcescibilis]|uniref:Transmembrane protein n=1 Tax=Coprinopsis marcescibilis TaxID=230819 RepID=A0A5C3KV02_COPMA|nr:hypothetical protein FA15DRAFT_669584 [Coprinopsis marcescibilis]